MSNTKHIDPEGVKVVVTCTALNSDDTTIAIGLMDQDPEDKNRYFVNMSKVDGDEDMGVISGVMLLAPFLNPEEEFEEVSWMEDLEVRGGIALDREAGTATFISRERIQVLKDVN